MITKVFSNVVSILPYLPVTEMMSIHMISFKLYTSYVCVFVFDIAELYTLIMSYCPV